MDCVKDEASIQHPVWSYSIDGILQECILHFSNQNVVTMINAKCGQ
jgi:hypothetical protein